MVYILRLTSVHYAEETVIPQISIIAVCRTNS